MTNEERDKIAREILKHGLLQFRAFDKYLIDNLIRNCLTFGAAQNFNDPFDCNLPIDVNNSIEEIRQYFQLANKNTRMEYSKELICKKANDYYNNRANLNEYISELIYDYRRFSCFTIASIKHHTRNSLFWANYANKHQGICMKFSPDFFRENIINQHSGIQFIPVEYCPNDKIPKFNYIRYRLNPKPNDSPSQYYFGTKSEEWKGESEIRLVYESIKKLKDPFYNIKFDPIHLEEVYLGCKLTPGDQKMLEWIFSLPKYQHVKLCNLKKTKNASDLIQF